MTRKPNMAQALSKTKKTSTRPAKKKDRRKRKARTAAKKAANRRGRPPGSKTQDTPTVETAATVCPKCKSTDRGPYFNIRQLESAGVHPEHGPYTLITWRRCRCLACGQLRDDKEFSRPTNGAAA